jgi:hypothetical protein
MLLRMRRLALCLRSCCLDRQLHWWESSSREGFLVLADDDSLVAAAIAVLLNEVARLIPETLCSGQGIDKGLGLDRPQSTGKRSVEEAGAGSFEDEIGHVVEILHGEVTDEFLLRYLHHLDAELADGALGDDWGCVVDSRVELGVVLVQSLLVEDVLYKARKRSTSSQAPA